VFAVVRIVFKPLEVYIRLLGMGLHKQTYDSRTDLDVGTPSAKLHNSVFLEPTSFLRCLACVAIVTIHVFWYVALATEDRHGIDVALADQTWLTVIFNPEPPMQTFMCLSGYYCKPLVR
jgi:hypothetical protein